MTNALDWEIIERLTELFNYHLNLSPGVYGSLRMSLQEAMTNVIDHSGVNDYFVCANSYRDQKLIRNIDKEGFYFLTSEAEYIF